MIVIPAIDLREGKCVRLTEGRPDQETVYSDDPVSIARIWEAEGASFLHVVDLDGAFAGKPKNMDVVKKIIAAINIPVQVGGGIRDLDTIEELLGCGARRVILGTSAIISPGLVAGACAKYGDSIVVGIDGRDGKVAIEGWGVTSEKSTVQLALEIKSLGVGRIVFTDIWRDGTLKGPNLAATREIAEATGLKIIAAGGISVVKDVLDLLNLEAYGVEGVIIGKALYARTIDLKEALAVCNQDKKKVISC
jgi:phosphoribosylformimino-5-aminoimidazole carboxamide ribotide isomerase